MLSIIEKVKTLRKLAREPDPKLTRAELEWLVPDVIVDENGRRMANPIDRRNFTDRTETWDKLKMEASHCLRFMLYVGRDPDGRLLLLGPQHFRMAANLYQTEKGIDVRGSKSAGLDWIYRGKDHKEYKETPWDGCANIIPPGHSKTNTIAHYIGLRLCRKPNLRVIIVHAQAREAEKNCQYVTKLFDEDEASGRRVLGLFPHVRIKNKNQGMLALKTKESMRQPTIRAYGVNAKASGGDADILWEDDVCDKEISDSDIQRDKVAGQLSQRWRRRLRPKPGGERPMDIISATLYHHDDPNSRIVKAAIANKVRYRVLRMACGGPDQKFRPIWREMFPASKLRRIYEEMRDPRAYAALYMSNPRPDEMRKVKRLAYFANDAAHAEFMRAPTTYLSIDPTATDNEKSDKAAFLYAAVGDVKGKDSEGKDVVRRIARILDAKEFRSTHVQLVPEVVAWCRAFPVDYVLMEVNGNNGYSTWELLQQLGIDVTICPPKNRAKEKRFEDIAPLLDESLRDKGFAGAVVQFMGRPRGDESVGQDPDYRWLYTQVLDFGTTKNDHACDALAQFVSHVRGDLDMAGATASIQAAKVEVTGDPRILKMLQAAEDELKPQPESDVFKFLAGRN